MSANQYNFTDPESRIRKAGNGKHFEQAYNAQAVVDEAMLIVGHSVSIAANDKQELAADVAALSPAVKVEVKAVLSNSRFYSEAMVRAVEQPGAGAASGLRVYAVVAKQSHHKSVADLRPQPTRRTCSPRWTQSLRDWPERAVAKPSRSTTEFSSASGNFTSSPLSNLLRLILWTQSRHASAFIGLRRDGQATLVAQHCFRLAQRHRHLQFRQRLR